MSTTTTTATSQQLHTRTDPRDTGVRPERRLLSAVHPRIIVDTSLPEPDAPHAIPDNASKLIGASGHWRVTGPAGSGVTTLLVEAALARIDAGIHPDRVVIVTASKESANRIRRLLATRLAARNFATAGKMVRSVHAFAFAILNDYSAHLSQPAPRLLTGAEHDAIMREMLLGHAEDGGAYWPEHLQPALPLVGFARSLRDFILRAQERGITAATLKKWGADFDRELWTASGHFLDEYQAIANLSGLQQLNASELTSRALAAINDPDSPNFRLETLQRIDTLIVDDAQQLDPVAAQLIQEFRQEIPTTIIAGDPHQAVFRFRGANPRFLSELPVTPDHDITLDKTHRNPHRKALITCERAATEPAIIADILRRSHLIEGNQWADHVVIVRESSNIASIKRALLAAGVPVHQDATDLVLAEHPLVNQLLLAITAALRPLEVTEVEALVLGPVGGADPVTLRKLIRGVRQAEMARGGRRRSLVILRELLHPSAETTKEEHDRQIAEIIGPLTAAEKAIFEHLYAVISAAKTAIDAGESVEQILWAAWEKTGLGNSLSAVALRGGARGSQADHALDAMMALFDMAGDFVERRPTASIASFIDTVNAQQLPTSARDRRTAMPDAVSILTAHGVSGQQWPHVIIAGVQEDSWPTIGETGTLFGQEELIDLNDDGLDPRLHVSRAGDKLAEELRLFELSLARATETIVVTTVNSPEEAQLVPSRFLEDLGEDYQRYSGEAIMSGHLAHLIGGEIPEPDSENSGALASTEEPPTLATLGQDSDDAKRQRQELIEHTEGLLLPSPLLAVPTMVAELRRFASDDAVPERVRKQAATQLARLAAAGIHSAHPDYWWGAVEPSTRTPLVEDSAPVVLSPSAVESLTTCPARHVITRALPGPLGETTSMHTGTLLHAIAEAVSNGVDIRVLRGLAHDTYDTMISGPQWEQDRLHRRLDGIIDNIVAWVSRRDAAADAVATEVDITVDIDLSQPAADGQPPAEDARPTRIRGRVDRLETYSDGLRIVDIKTGNQPTTKEKAATNPQLATYQYAFEHAVADGHGGFSTAPKGQGQTVAGAQLAYVAKPSSRTVVTERDQPALDDDSRQVIRNLLADAARASIGPSVLAKKNPTCTSCPIRIVCPVSAEGKATTHEP
ncbi:ATP-dependent DNA helicase [Corynebacterium aquilae]|uniref:ATP-dependent DNA helicase n=1 Tax=Corynebacterium aquilae TaxID=203263 RepID=UPI00095342D0|nr:ATP-dependent DNA helicase [Corynebacterium aquilae]